MNHIEYDMLRANRPELKLRSWYMLRPEWRQYVESLTEDQVIARRTGVLLAREYGVGWDDYGRAPGELVK